MSAETKTFILEYIIRMFFHCISGAVAFGVTCSEVRDAQLCGRNTTVAEKSIFFQPAFLAYRR